MTVPQTSSFRTLTLLMNTLCFVNYVSLCFLIIRSRIHPFHRNTTAMEHATFSLPFFCGKIYHLSHFKVCNSTALCVLMLHNHGVIYNIVLSLFLDFFITPKENFKLISSHFPILPWHLSVCVLFYGFTCYRHCIWLLSLNMF